MYKSLESTPVKDWEVIPSIDIDVGAQLKSMYPDEDFIISINTGLMEQALKILKSKDAKPSIVRFNLQKDIVQIEDQVYGPVTGQAFAEKTDWGTNITMCLFYKDNPAIALTTSEQKKTVIHELQHAADFASEEQITKEVIYARQVTNLSPEAFNLTSIYPDRPFEIRAMKAEKRARNYPPIITITTVDNQNQ